MVDSIRKKSISLLVSVLWIYFSVAFIAVLEALFVAFESTHAHQPQESSAALESLLDTVGIFLFVSLFTLPAIVLFLICEKRAWTDFGKDFPFGSLPLHCSFISFSL